MKSIVAFIILVFVHNAILSQPSSDSVKVTSTLEELFTVCNSSVADEADPLKFERLAPYIVYRGEDASRKWITACDYNIAEDRKMVDQAGYQIKKLLDEYDTYQIGNYMTKMESEGQWHALTIKFKKGDVKKEFLFAFLKIGDAILLGDID